MPDLDHEAADALRAASQTIRDLRQRLAQTSAVPAHEPIAIVALACRLPGGVRTPEDYWRILMRGASVTGPVPAWRWAGRPPQVGGGEYAGTIEDVEYFDHAFFGISESDARAMDPQQRLFLEAAWQSLERWGRVPADVEGESLGVFVGAGHQDYMTALTTADVPVTAATGPGNARSIIANRVSYLFGLRGPSLVVDTACSSSLVAVHLAVQSLRAGECDAAIAGGVNLILAPDSSLVTGRALPLAPDGQTRTFAADAQGMVRGEGVAAVVLRPLARALEDGDHIHAVINASGVNQDGRTNGLTAPSPTSQGELIARVLSASGLAGDEICYVETHGTGTPLGDPIEVEALRGVYGGQADGPACWLGSVKPLIGHLESAAGIASLVKAVLAIENGLIPPQANFGQLNPEVDLTGTRFAVPSQGSEWAGDGPRHAAVSSFGFGGTNSHVILSQAPVVPTVEESNSVGPGASSGRCSEPVIVAVSGHTEASASALADGVEGYLAAHPEQRVPLASTLALRRTHFRYRSAWVSAPGQMCSAPAPQERQAGGTVLLFGGQATSWPTMLLEDPLVTAEAERWDATSSGSRFAQLIDAARQDPARSRDTRVAQAVVGVVQSASARRLLDLGLDATGTLGHSLGEVVASHIAGFLSLAQASDLIRSRAERHHAHAANGAMVSLRADRADVEDLLQRATISDLGVAAINSPHATVVSGPRAAVEELLAHPDCPRAHRLDTDYAFHSPQLARHGSWHDLEVETSTRSPRLPLFSTVTGEVFIERLDRSHWRNNLTGPVMFDRAVRTALAEGNVRFIDVSPQPVLASHVHRIAEEVDRDVRVFQVADAADNGLDHACRAACAQAWAHGAALDWSQMIGPSSPIPDLPTTVLVGAPLWLPGSGSEGARMAEAPRCDAVEPGEVLRRMQELVAEAVDDSMDSVDVHCPATELDVDSAQFVEIKNRLEGEFAIAVPMTLLLGGASLADLADRLSSPAGPGAPKPDGPPVAVPGRAAGARTDVSQMSDAEVDALLAALSKEGDR